MSAGRKSRKNESFRKTRSDESKTFKFQTDKPRTSWRSKINFKSKDLTKESRVEKIQDKNFESFQISKVGEIHRSIWIPYWHILENLFFLFETILEAIASSLFLLKNSDSDRKWFLRIQSLWRVWIWVLLIRHNRI